MRSSLMFSKFTPLEAARNADNGMCAFSIGRRRFALHVKQVDFGSGLPPCVIDQREKHRDLGGRTLFKFDVTLDGRSLFKGLQVFAHVIAPWKPTPRYRQLSD